MSPLLAPFLVAVLCFLPTFRSGAPDPASGGRSEASASAEPGQQGRALREHRCPGEPRPERLRRPRERVRERIHEPGRERVIERRREHLRERIRRHVEERREREDRGRERGAERRGKKLRERRYI